MSGRRRIVVLGILGRLPFAGIAWQVLHYLEGLRRLGHDVFYVEDTGEWPYDAERNAVTDDCGYTLHYTRGSWPGAVSSAGGRTGPLPRVVGPSARRPASSVISSPASTPS